MDDSFHLLDLRSQAPAVQRYLRGRSMEDKLAWLTERGELTPIPISLPGALPHYRFVSPVALECIFFIKGDEFVFLGDHTTFTVKDVPRP